MAQRHETKARGSPTFKSDVEAGAFWDTHSPEDYPEAFQGGAGALREGP